MEDDLYLVTPTLEILDTHALASKSIPNIFQPWHPQHCLERCIYQVDNHLSLFYSGSSDIILMKWLSYNIHPKGVKGENDMVKCD